MCALYAIAVWTDMRRFLPASACSSPATCSPPRRAGGNVKTAALFTGSPILAMVLVRGAVRGRQLRADALAARAELLEREHELRAHEAVAEERARIARELHDLVAHNVSVMVVQAGAERHALGPSRRRRARRWPRSSRPGARRSSRRAGCSACCGAADDGDELEPQPSVEHIDVLVEQIERAGLPVTLAVEGEPVAAAAGRRPVRLPHRAGGLTNALKHAGPAHAEVVLRYAPRALDVEVRDDGRGPARARRTARPRAHRDARARGAVRRGARGRRARRRRLRVHAHLPLA